jgi:hypothetical protein
MSDTPRTDAAAGFPSTGWKITATNLFDESQKLERELNAAKELIREIRDNEANAVDEATKFLRDYPINEHNK